MRIYHTERERRYGFPRQTSFRSGQGIFRCMDGVLIDAEDQTILVIKVLDKEGKPMLMINSEFDKPRGPEKWVPLRKHVRKLIYEVIRDHKIVKVRPDFINGFRTTFNYTPTQVDFERHKRNIIINSLDQLRSQYGVN